MWIMLFVLAGSSAAEAPKTEAKQVMRELEGVWVCESATINGKTIDKERAKALKLTLKGERYKTERGDEVLFDSTYSLDTKADPKHIDMVGTEGDLKGKTAEGIYELKKDRLTICYTMPGQDRPKAFESKEDSEAYLVVWRRMKPTEK